VFEGFDWCQRDNTVVPFAGLPPYGASSYDDLVRRIAASDIRQARVFVVVAGAFSTS